MRDRSQNEETAAMRKLTFQTISLIFAMTIPALADDRYPSDKDRAQRAFYECARESQEEYAQCGSRWSAMPGCEIHKDPSPILQACKEEGDTYIELCAAMGKASNACRGDLIFIARHAY